MSVRIGLAKEDDELQSCYPVMAQLRPHVPSGEFLQRVKRQAEIADYKIAYLTDLFE